MRVCTVHTESIGVSLLYLSNFYGIMRCHEPLDRQIGECLPYFTVAAFLSIVSNYRKMSIDILKVECKPLSFLPSLRLPFHVKWPMRLWSKRIISTSYDMHEIADKCQEWYRIFCANGSIVMSRVCLCFPFLFDWKIGPIFILCLHWENSSRYKIFDTHFSISSNTIGILKKEQRNKQYVKGLERCFLCNW